MGRRVMAASVGPLGNPVKSGRSGCRESNAGGPAITATGRRSSPEIRRPSGVVRRRDLRILAVAPETTLRIGPADEDRRERARTFPYFPNRPRSGWQPADGAATVDRTLVERAQAGDQAAFEGLVRMSANRLFAIAYRILRDHHAAEDALQQTLVTIWDDLPKLRDPDRFEAWSYRVIVRTATADAKRGRRGGAVVRLLPDDADASRARDEYGPIADRDQIERGFRRLTPEQRGDPRPPALRRPVAGGDRRRPGRADRHGRLSPPLRHPGTPGGARSRRAHRRREGALRMTSPNDFDRRLGAWLDEGPGHAPERTIDAALAHARAHPRRRDPLAVLRRDPMSGNGFAGALRPLPLVAVLGLILVAALGVATVGGFFRQPAVVRRRPGDALPVRPVTDRDADQSRGPVQLAGRRPGRPDRRDRWRRVRRDHRPVGHDGRRSVRPGVRGRRRHRGHRCHEPAE